MNDELVDLIVGIAGEQNVMLPRPVEIRKKAEAGLYGMGGPLDSIALVTFIIEIEAAVEKRFGVGVILADERAMSQERSPFRTIGSLAAYIETKVKESGGHATL